jgi:hypothetical protein
LLNYSIHFSSSSTSSSFTPKINLSPNLSAYLSVFLSLFVSFWVSLTLDLKPPCSLQMLVFCSGFFQLSCSMLRKKKKLQLGRSCCKPSFVFSVFFPWW